ncbi:MAG: hypothetical protein HRT37_23530 [Alteromonadaceae bacterium]|nr:hypothetical protein [Alteromonadaceae bacterium]
MAVWLDLTFKLKSGGAIDEGITLDHLMRRMWTQYGRNGKGTTAKSFLAEIATTTLLQPVLTKPQPFR